MKAGTAQGGARYKDCEKMIVMLVITTDSDDYCGDYHYDDYFDG